LGDDVVSLPDTVKDGRAERSLVERDRFARSVDPQLGLNTLDGGLPSVDQRDGLGEACLETARRAQYARPSASARCAASVQVSRERGEDGDQRERPEQRDDDRMLDRPRCDTEVPPPRRCGGVVRGALLWRGRQIDRGKSNAGNTSCPNVTM